MVPQEVSKNIGEDTVFICHSYMKGKWTFNNNKLPLNTFVSGNRDEILKIYSIDLKNAGSYQCIVGDNQTKVVAEGTLEVYGEYTCFYLVPKILNEL